MQIMHKIKLLRFFKGEFYQNNDAYAANSAVFKICRKSMLHSKSYSQI